MPPGKWPEDKLPWTAKTKKWPATKMASYKNGQLQKWSATNMYKDYEDIVRQKLKRLQRGGKMKGRKRKVCACLKLAG